MIEQTKLESAVEVTANIVIGFAINYVANITILPYMWGAPDSGNTFVAAWWIGIAFTVVSVARQWVLRRYYNGRRFSEKLVADMLQKWTNIKRKVVSYNA